jgi:hypothetical protein
MMRVTNLMTRSLTLSDGTILAAAGTKGASKPVEVISDADRQRLAGRGYISISEVTVEAPTSRPSRTLPTPPKGEKEN